MGVSLFFLADMVKFCSVLLFRDKEGLAAALPFLTKLAPYLALVVAQNICLLTLLTRKDPCKKPA